MPEILILDPSEVSTSRTQLDISNWVRAEGADYGDAEITAYLADRERGSAPVDFRIPNRQIVLPLSLRSVGGVSHNTIRANLQKKVARIQQEGGWIKRQTQSGALFADVVNASLSLGGSWMQSRTNNPVDIEAELHLECLPDWYGNEITLPLRSGFGSMTWTETGILGDYPGRMRMTVDATSGQSQQGLLGGIRARHYSTAPTATLELSAYTPLDAATGTGPTTHTNLSTGWTPICSTDAAGISKTHTGTYRVWVRVSVNNPVGDVVRLRLLWDVGDFQLPTENEPVSVPTVADYYSVDLGEIRLDRTPSGTHRWRGVIQGAGLIGGEDITIDRIYLVPVDEGYWVLKAPLSVDPGLVSYSARDEFNQSPGGGLVGKSLAFGGVWAGAGDTDDFNVNANTHTADRQVGADPSAFAGHFALAGANNFTTIVSQVDVKRASFTNRTGLSGPFARYVSPTQNFIVGLAGQAPNTAVAAYLTNGATQTLGVYNTSFRDGQWYTIRLYVDSLGRWMVWFYNQGGSPGKPVLNGTATELGTGGALATGRVGFYDSITTNLGAGGAADLRSYDNYAAWQPSTDAVVFANQSAEIRTEGMFREDPTGAAFGPVTYVTGDLPRIPPSGSEGRTVQFFLKTSRGEFERLPDQGTNDSFTARVSYRPSYLLTA